MKITRLNHYGTVCVSGADADNFLQRQFTSDICEITSERGGISAYLNPKGRILANFIIFRKDDSFYLILSADLVESFSDRLRKFVFRDKVNISIQSESQIVGVLNDERMGLSDLLPDHAFHVMHDDFFTYIRVPGIPRRIAVYGDKRNFERYSGQFDESLTAQWKQADIDCMHPLINSYTTEELILQATNLDLTGAVSFTKGCYPGQEIVARLHYKGGVNRRMFQASVPGDDRSQSGSLIYCDEVPGRQTGSVVNSVRPNEFGDKNLLVSLPLKFLGHDRLRLEDGTNLQLRLDGIPYAIPELERN
ncbi:MAG: hypothetical protein OXI60_03195 [Acidiferrobacterales bacterium]|nr:hypothetical protein [Acidiferrobacterales bacterium]